MIFKIFQIKKDINEARQKPVSFGLGKGGEFILGILIIPIIIYVSVVVLLFLSGYTETFGFESLLARVIFWIIFVPGVISSFVFLKVRRFLKKISKKGDQFVDEKMHKNTRVIESEVIEEIVYEKE